MVSSSLGEIYAETGMVRPPKCWQCRCATSLGKHEGPKFGVASLSHLIFRKMEQTPHPVITNDASL